MMNQQLDLNGGRHDLAPATESQKLFDPAPQIKGQIALDTDGFCEQSGALKSECVGCNSTPITAELYVFIPDHGGRETFLAETEREAQLYAAENWHGVPGVLYHTGEFYPSERFSDGFVRALTDGLYTLADEIAGVER